MHPHCASQRTYLKSAWSLRARLWPWSSASLRMIGLLGLIALFRGNLTLDGQPLCMEMLFGDIPAGALQSVTCLSSWVAPEPPPFTHALRACADPEDLIPEMNEGDKCATLSLGGGGETPVILTAPPATRELVLYPNYPNPFNPSTQIRMSIPKHQHVTVLILDSSGRFVAQLWNDALDAGYQTPTWHGKDAQGREVASGIFFCAMLAEEGRQTRKLVRLHECLPLLWQGWGAPVFWVDVLRSLEDKELSQTRRVAAVHSKKGVGS